MATFTAVKRRLKVGNHIINGVIEHLRQTGAGKTPSRYTVRNTLYGQMTSRRILDAEEIVRKKLAGSSAAQC